MRAVTLASGSSGNCVLVEAQGRRLLVDAGLPPEVLASRLARLGVRPRDVDAILVTHDHRDHVAHLAPCARMAGATVFVSELALAATRRRMRVGRIGEVRTFVAGDVLDVGGLRVETVAVPHDAADTVGFVVDDGRWRVAVVTDVGAPTEALSAVVASVDGLLIESNHDEAMLAAGPYPPFLKARIAGPLGHLSNGESASMVTGGGSRLRWVCLCHLSAENNSPAAAVAAWRSVLPEGVAVVAAPRDREGPVLELPGGDR